MKWYQLWKKIGKQPLKITQYNDVKIFINNEEYLLDKIKYESGVPIGLVAMVVKDESDLEEYDDHCYECGGYGDDYSVDEEGNLVSNCDDCPYNGCDNLDD